MLTLEKMCFLLSKNMPFRLEKLIFLIYAVSSSLLELKQNERKRYADNDINFIYLFSTRIGAFELEKCGLFNFKIVVFI